MIDKKRRAAPPAPQCCFLKASHARGGGTMNGLSSRTAAHSRAAFVREGVTFDIHERCVRCRAADCLRDSSPCQSGCCADARRRDEEQNRRRKETRLRCGKAAKEAAKAEKAAARKAKADEEKAKAEEKKAA